MRVYLDHNATTPMRPEARDELVRCIDRLGGNPSSLHAAGRTARQVLDDARERVAAALRVHEDEIIFTASGTEANNLALLGALGAMPEERGLLTTTVEHSAVLAAADDVARVGRAVYRIRVDEEGTPDLTELSEQLATGRFGVVSVMAANNEVGTLSPLSEIADRLEPLGDDRPRFHTDAAQALGRVPIELDRWRVDLASFSAHKLGGPLGVGVLVRKQGVPLTALLHGGGQEHGLRPGTENVPAIASAAIAIELAVREQADYEKRMRELSSVFWRQVQAVLPEAVLLGPEIGSARRLSNTLNLSLAGVEGHVLVTRLDLAGLEVSAGSACASGSLEPSHVLRAMGLSDERARAGLRVSFGRTSTPDDSRAAVDALRRTFSPTR
jgi:cysteine desulfurase